MSDLSFATSSPCGSVWSGGLSRFGIGHRRSVLSPPVEAIHRRSGEMATALMAPLWPIS